MERTWLSPGILVIPNRFRNSTVPALSRLPLVLQERWRLHEKHGKGPQGKICHGELRVAATPLIRQRPAALAQHIQQTLRHLHKHDEPEIGASWNPGWRRMIASSASCCTADSLTRAQRHGQNENC